MVEAFAYRDAPRYLIRDRDSIYQGEFQRGVRSLRISEVLTAPQSPWQNPYGASHWIYPEGVSKPLRRFERPPLEEDSSLVFRLLSSITHALGSGEGMSRRTTGYGGRKDHRDTAAWWASSPI